MLRVYTFEQNTGNIAVSCSASASGEQNTEFTLSQFSIRFSAWKRQVARRQYVVEREGWQNSSFVIVARPCGLLRRLQFCAGAEALSSTCHASSPALGGNGSFVVGPIRTSLLQPFLCSCEQYIFVTTCQIQSAQHRSSFNISSSTTTNRVNCFLILVAKK